MRKLLTSTLTQAGFSVDEAKNGSDAVAKVRANDYLVIVMDLMMPVSSGFDAVHAIQLNKPGIGKRVVVLSAATGKKKARLDPAQVFTIMQKPFDPAKLVETVKRCADQSGSTGRTQS